MKKFIKYVLFFVLVLLMFSTKEMKASTGSTVFIGEPVVLDSYENVEITLNDVEINEETSEVKNTHLFTNLSDETITRKATIKLEDSFSNFTINSLKIIVNDHETKEIAKEGENYNFSFEIPPQEGKKIEIIYKTDNDLQNAKIIKYSLDKLKGKYIGKFRINILFQEEDIPLVEKIYPSCYEFDYTNNTMNTTYYSFTVNNLTTNFIVQKDTYKNLIYGMGEELSERNIYILKNAKTWIKEGLDFDYTDIGKNKFGKISYYGYIEDLEEQITKNIQITKTQNEDSYLFESINMIEKYIVYKQLKKDNKIQYINELIKNDYYESANSSILFMIMDGYNPLVFDYFVNYILDKNLNEYYEYKICIDYVKSEGNKELYIYKNIGETEISEYKYFRMDEYSILRTKNKNWTPDRIATREIAINVDIDGNEIEATEEEKIAYVNMINADLYIREIIYDGNTEVVEYYDGEKSIRVKEPVYGYYNSTGRKILEASGYEEHALKDFKNEYVKNNSQIPTFARAVGYLGIIDNKNVVAMTGGLGGRTPYDYIKTIKTDLAQELIKANRANNQKIKNNIDTKIASAGILTNTEEYRNIIETTNSNKDNENIVSIVSIKENNKDNNIMELIKNNKIYIIIASAILTIFIILIILNKRRKNNGRK